MDGVEPEGRALVGAFKGAGGGVEGASGEE